MRPMRFPAPDLRCVAALLCATVTALALGAPGAVAKQSNSTVLTGATDGRIIGFDHATGRLLVETETGPNTYLQTRTPTGALGKSVSIGTTKSGAQPKAIGNGVVAVVFFGGTAASRKHVEIYNASTLTLVANVKLGFIPQGVAVAGGRVWLVVPQIGLLESFPVSGAHTITTYPATLPTSTNASIIAGSDAAATIYVEDGPTSQTLAVHASTTPTITGTRNAIYSNLVVSGDGSVLEIPAGAGAVELASPTTLANIRTLTIPATPFYVGLSYDGTRIAVSDATSATTVATYWVIDTTTGEVLYTDSPKPVGLQSAEQPLTFTSDSAFAVITKASIQDLHPTFMAFTVPATPRYWANLSTVQLTGGALNATATFSDTLEGSPQPGAGNQPIDVTLTPPAGVPITDAVTTSVIGSFSYTTPTLDHTGTWTVTFSFAGDGTYQPVSVSKAMNVAGTADTLTLASNVSKTLVYNKSLSLTATLAPFTPGAQITIWKTVLGTKTAVYTGPVGPSGTVQITQTPKLTATYSATFTGDDTYNPATSKTVPIAVVPILKGTWPGGYRTASGYRLFHSSASCMKTHKSGCPQLKITATPNLKGHTVYMVIQQKNGSSWKSVYQAHHKLGAASQATLPIPYTKSAIGTNYRIVLVYNGDKVGHGAIAWGYWGFRVTK